MNSNRPPNFLFLFPDQHRPDWIGTNPELPIRTPNLDRLIKEGVYFSKTICPSPLCAPSRAALASGKEYHNCGVVNNSENYPLDQPTYYQSLRNAGYVVCGVGKFDLHKPEPTWGVDGSHLLKEWGFTCGIDNEGKIDGFASYRNDHVPKGPYLNYLHQKGLGKVYMEDLEVRRAVADGAYTTAMPDDAYCDNWVANNGINFLKDFPKDQPWHLVVNFTGPHSPMDVTASMRERWENVAIPPPHNPGDESPDVLLNLRRNYAAMIENIDMQMGRMIKLVEERGELDNTIIVYASDHGEMLGDHGRWGKNIWYQQSVGIPLVIVGPGIKKGVKSEALVNLFDLAATFIDYAGSKPMPDMDAISLRPLLEGKTEQHRDYLLSGLNDWSLVSDGRYKLVLQEGQPEMLYDLETDPWEDVNIADEKPEMVEKLKELLKSDPTSSRL